MKLFSGAGRRVTGSRRSSRTAQKPRSAPEYREEEYRQSARSAETAQSREATRVVRRSAESAPEGRNRPTQGHSIPAVDLSAIRQSDLPKVVRSDDAPYRRPVTRPSETYWTLAGQSC